MLDILFTILIFSGLMVMFKLFTRFNVDNLQAIAVCYLAAGVCGVIAMGRNFDLVSSLQSDYLIPSIIVGLLFGIIFNMMAFSTQKIGLSITSVANKISLVIPVSAGILWFGESSNIVKIVGIVLALLAIYFSTTTGGKLSFNRKYLWLLLFIFVGQGVADTTFKVAQDYYVDASDSGAFFALIFFAAGILGSIAVLIKLAAGKTKLKFRNLLWGIMVGVPNYFTLHYFFRALENSPLESSQIYPVVNIGVIVILAIVGIVVFRERLSRTNWIGVVLATLAIALITFSKEILALFG